MSLAALLGRYPDEVVCDLAETYGIYDYRAHPGRLVATLVCGLRPSSRVMMRLAADRSPAELSAPTAFASPEAFECARLKVLQGG